MRFVTLSDPGGPRVAVVIGDQAIPMGDARLTMRDVAGGAGRIPRRRSRRGVPLAGAHLGPVIPYPGAVYTVGANYRSPGEGPDPAGSRPLIYGKAASSVGAPGATLGWDRTLTANVDPECELGVVIGRPTFKIAPEAAVDHVFGYTIVNDISSRDSWLDGDQWLLGKSMPGFCPVGPWIVTPDELDPADLRLGCTINGQAIQDGRTSSMRFRVAEIIAFLSRHMTLRPGDLIATGTPPRLTTPPGPDRHLQPGDTVTAWIEGIGELRTTIA